MSFFNFLNFMMTSPGNQSNPINLNMTCHVLLLSITFVPNFMIVVFLSRSYLEIWPRAILMSLMSLRIISTVEIISNNIYFYNYIIIYFDLIENHRQVKNIV